MKFIIIICIFSLFSLYPINDSNSNVTLNSRVRMMENDAFNLHRSTTDLMRDVKTLLGHVERLKIDVANIKNGSHQRVNMPQQITPLANQIKSHLSEIFIKVDKFNNDHRRNASEEVEAAIQEWNRLKAEQDALCQKTPKLCDSGI